MRTLKPKTELTSKTPETVYPKIIFELVNPGRLDITVDLPREGDLVPFAQMITWLNEGKLLPNIRQALNNSPNPRAGAVDTALAVTEKMDKDEPMICPSKAIAYNIRKSLR